MVKQAGTVLRYLRNLDRNVRGALAAGGLLVGQTGQDYAPIFTRTMERSVGATPALPVPGGYRVLVGPGPEAPYARYTEEDRYVEHKSLGPKSEAKGTARLPWLRPALRDNEQTIRGLVVSAVRSTRA